MKGVIPDCLEKLVKSKFGKDKWEDSLEAAGLPRYTSFLPTADIADVDVIKVVESACKVLNITLQQAADAFGDFWVNDYSQRMYKLYYKQANTARDFLLSMDNVHEAATNNMPNAHPPRFTYNWKNANTLVMTYKSSRGLIDFMVGLIKGVGRYYKEELQVMKLGNESVQIVF